MVDLLLAPFLGDIDRDTRNRDQQGQPGELGQLDARAERDEHLPSIDDRMPGERD